jgi:hypothetical protein
MQLPDEIMEAIVKHPSEDVVLVARELTQQYKRHIPVSVVVRIRGSLQRAANVSRAKEKASNTLEGKVAIMESVSDDLLNIFKDTSLPLRDRIEASKELRQWTKLSVDTAGIHDAETDTLFVIERDWDVLPDAT